MPKGQKGREEPDELDDSKELEELDEPDGSEELEEPVELDGSEELDGPDGSEELSNWNTASIVTLASGMVKLYSPSVSQLTSTLLPSAS